MMHITNADGSHSFVFPEGDGVLNVNEAEKDRFGRLWAHVEAKNADGGTINLARLDLLNHSGRTSFAVLCASRNGQSPDVWDRRLVECIDTVRTSAEEFRAGQSKDPTAAWTQAISASEFLQQVESEVPTDVRDLVIPGCITIVAAPRASGKSLVAMFLGVALATGGIFRGERVPHRRILLVDRDNPTSIVRKRLRWLGAEAVTALKVLTRDNAPPLTDRAAWAQFPAGEYDVAIIDSLGAATEGVSEKEGKETQEFLATLKDLARRGPAVLALSNTVKSGLNFRGRGELADAVDVLYEARNITGWTPGQGDSWWEDLPDSGEHAWQQRATRRKGQSVLRVAFIPSKFRLGIEPDPFALEIDTTTVPWTLCDITADLAEAGEKAAQAERTVQQDTLRRAAQSLVSSLRRLPEGQIMGKRDAEDILRTEGLSSRQAKNLLERGMNRDFTPEGLWVLRPCPGVKNNPIAVMLAEKAYIDNEGVQPKHDSESPRKDATSEELGLYTSMPGGVQPTASTRVSNDAIVKGHEAVHQSASGCTASEASSTRPMADESDGDLGCTPQPSLHAPSANPVKNSLPEGWKIGFTGVCLVHGNPASRHEVFTIQRQLTWDESGGAPTTCPLADTTSRPHTLCGRTRRCGCASRAGRQAPSFRRGARHAISRHSRRMGLSSAAERLCSSGPKNTFKIPAE